MGVLKSSYEVAMEKTKKMGIEDNLSLSEEQKQRIAEIRRECKAKIAEKKILLEGAPELSAEIQKLEKKRDQEIEALYEEALQKKG